MGKNPSTSLSDGAWPKQRFACIVGAPRCGTTTLALRIATQLARAGHQVTLTTTDPAAHVDAAARERPATLQVTRIDPAAETRRYTEEVLATDVRIGADEGAGEGSYHATLSVDLDGLIVTIALTRES
jgi:anion-transporting  ArsA/GET3 family ATPase